MRTRPLVDISVLGLVFWGVWSLRFAGVQNIGLWSVLAGVGTAAAIGEESPGASLACAPKATRVSCWRGQANSLKRFAELFGNGRSAFALAVLAQGVCWLRSRFSRNQRHDHGGCHRCCVGLLRPRVSWTLDCERVLAGGVSR